MPGKSKHGKAFKKRKLTRMVQPEEAAVATQAPAAAGETSRATTVQTARGYVAPASVLAAKVPLSHLISVGTELRTITVLSIAMVLILVLLAYILP